MTSIIKVQNIQYTDGDAALTIADGGGVTAATTLGVTGNTTLSGNLSLADNNKIYLGTGNDLEIYHNGSESYIADVGTGGVKFRASTIRWEKNDGSETLGGVDADGGWFFKANNTTALNIDTSGRVTKPLTPRFAVYKSGSEQYINTANMGSVAVAITWNTAEVNIGSHFDLANEKFTAPVTGTYRFDFQMLTGIKVPSSGVYWVTYNLMSNGSTGTRLAGTPEMYVESYNSSGTSSAGQGGSGYHFIKVSGGCFAELAANDYVKLMMFGSDSSNVRVHSGVHSTWSGYLIG